MDLSNVQVLGVQGRNTKSGKTVFDVTLSDGQKYATFDAATATKAQQFVGQAVDARVSVRQNGQYTNRYLEDIATPGALPPDTTQNVSIAPQNGAVAPIPMAPPSSGGMDPEREARIVKQSVLSTASNIVGHVFTGAGPEALEEAETRLLALAKKLYVEVYGEQAVAQPAPVPQPTPQEIAASVPGVTVGAW